MAKKKAARKKTKPDVSGATAGDAPAGDQLTGADGRPVSFEESLEELHAIVGELESGEVGLETSLERFERGMTLLRGCHAKLEAVEQRINVLTGFAEDGSAETEPFDNTATSEGGAGRRDRTGTAGLFE